MKTSTLTVLLLLCGILFSQVGINTSTPNDASILDVVSNEKGVLIPRLSDTDRDGNLADNDILTVPPFGVVNTAITPGLLIFNSDANAFQFWDGELWRQLFYNTTTLMGNEGVVKVNSGGIDQELPKYNLTHSGNSYGTAQEVIYELPLNYASSPTTSWPENIVSPADSDIYVNTTSGYK